MASLDWFRQQLTAALHQERFWQTEFDALTAKCRALQNAKASAAQIYADLMNANTYSPFADQHNWHFEVANANCFYAHCCANVRLYESRVQWAYAELQGHKYVHLHQAKVLWVIAKLQEYRANVRRAEEVFATAERRERENQQAQAQQQQPTRPSNGITMAKVRAFREQAAESFKNYTAMTTFPDPPAEPCKRVACHIATRALKACPCNIKKCFAGLRVRDLKAERGKWHPDRFSKCQGGKTAVVEMQTKAQEIFTVIGDLYDEAVARNQNW
ncbi:hypothetical protein Tdes44962_MAKER07604 [Teratosphaeria destructans]|uniref:Uncharacterized protein n=1 Tax=Teratosphaeria destructans TaxID=418781 RepID=A0A9W7W5S4_9PEZI|nr:hypothetical protein Tdes44962_MAKER07604 [Teratosphaeria destructans]